MFHLPSFGSQYFNISPLTPPPMTSPFNLLTAGGARFDRKRFGSDIELFDKTKSKSKEKGKSKLHKGKSTKSKALPASLDFFHDQPKADDGNESDASSSSASSSSSALSIPEPPQQKITLSGNEPLPKSLHANLPSLTTHSVHPLTSASGTQLLSALRNSNIHSLWGVQCAVGGCILEGRDVLCVAPTGSGKTLSYLLPTLVRLRDPARSNGAKGVRSLVLVPTHDLAVQIHAVLKTVTRGRAWRALVLTKATERAVCDSAPGKASRKQASGSDDDSQEEDDEEEEEDGDEEESESEDGPSAGLGLDVLIATPERLHHLIDSQRLSLAE